MSIQYLQTLESLSQEDLQRNGSFPTNYTLPAYPLTPYPIVPETRDFSPSTLVIWDNLVQTTGPDAKPRIGTRSNAPSASSLYRSSLNPSLNISSTEFQSVLNSLLDQVDWLEVAVKVAKNRAPSIYYNAIEKILLAYKCQLVKAEGKDGEVSKLENRNSDKEYMYMCEGDNKDEYGIGGDCGCDHCEDKPDNEYEDDEVDKDEYDEDSEYEFL